MKELLELDKGVCNLLKDGNRRGKKKSSQLVLVLTMLLISVFLAACGTPMGEPSASSETSEALDTAKTSEQETEASTSSEGLAVSQPLVVAVLPECDGILLELDAVIEGKRLGDCMVAAMLEAGTGIQRVKSDDGSQSLVHFKWDPDYSMNVENGEYGVVIKGDTGWLKSSGGKWIQENANSEDPETVMATIIVQAVRAFSDPRIMSEYYAMSPTWTVVDEASVPDPEAFVDVGWHLIPEGPIDYGLVILTDVGLWLTNDYLGAYYVGTGSTGGIAVTTSNTFLQWGGPVEIPDPEKFK